MDSSSGSLAVSSTLTDQPQKRLAGQMNWTGTVARRGIVGWRNEVVAVVRFDFADSAFVVTGHREN